MSTFSKRKKRRCRLVTFSMVSGSGKLNLYIDSIVFVKCALWNRKYVGLLLTAAFILTMEITLFIFVLDIKCPRLSRLSNWSNRVHYSFTEHALWACRTCIVAIHIKCLFFFFVFFLKKFTKQKDTGMSEDFVF